MRQIDLPAIDIEAKRPRNRTRRHIMPDRIDRRTSLARRLKIHLRARQPVLAIILRALQFNHVQMRVNELDERQKQRPVQPVLVQVLRRPVRRGDDHHPARQQLFKQAPDDHRIGDIADLHLVKRQKPQVGDDAVGKRAERILQPVLPGGMDRAVGGLHEGVKVDPALAGDRGRVGKQVHQHRLAAPDPAPQIQPLGGWCRFDKQGGQNAGLAQGLRLQPLPQVFKPPRHCQLLGVGLDCTLHHTPGQNIRQTFTHQVL